MSHFCVIVLCPSDQQDDREALVSRAEKALSPFSEELEVEPYLDECFCVGARARRHASELADLKVGPLVRWRDQYRQKTESEREATPWETYISPWRQACEQAESEHPLYRSPDPECSECLGTGERETTYNRQAKWDWYQLGGRFTGSLVPSYEPSKDPRNIQTCDLCLGAGDRPGVLYYRAVRESGEPFYTTTPPGLEERYAELKERNEWPEIIGAGSDVVTIENMGLSPGELPEPAPWCDGCDGTGQRLKWPTEWVECEGDIQPVAVALRQRFVPFAIIDGKGRWFERGQMGWFGMSINNQEEKAWERTVMAIYEEHARDHMALVFDLHI